MIKTFFAKFKIIHKLGIIFTVLIVAAVGTYLLTGSHAATPYGSGTASSGSLSGGSQVVQNCSGASAGSCVVFNKSVPMDGNVGLALSNPGAPFASSSFWNTLLPATTPASPNSAAYVNDIAAILCTDYNPPSDPPATPCASPSNAALDTFNWSTPLYVVPADQPYVPVQVYCSNGTNQSTAFINTVLAPGIPIPSDAHAAGATNTPVVDTDETIAIYQPSTDKYWDLWRLQKTSSGGWEACYGGVMNSVSQSNGIFPAYGASATGLPIIGGLVRIEELQAGQINHVMGLELPGNLLKTVLPSNTSSATTGISWPAFRSDGTNTNPLAIPEGLRLRLNPNLDLNTLDLSPVAKVIAIAAQKYGFIVRDTAGNVAIPIGDPTTYTAAGLPDPYQSGPGVGGAGSNGLFGGVQQYLIMKNFPWDQLQALPFNYGEPATP